MQETFDVVQNPANDAATGRAREDAFNVPLQPWNRMPTLAERLVEGTIDEASVDFLTKTLRAQRRIAVMGTTASGKTSMVGSLLRALPSEISTVVFGDPLEVCLPGSWGSNLLAMTQDPAILSVEDIVRGKCVVFPEGWTWPREALAASRAAKGAICSVGFTSYSHRIGYPGSKIMVTLEEWGSDPKSPVFDVVVLMDKLRVTHCLELRSPLNLHRVGGLANSLFPVFD